MKKKTYFAPTTELVMVMPTFALLSGSDYTQVIPDEDEEEVEGVELGINTINLWDE